MYTEDQVENILKAYHGALFFGRKLDLNHDPIFNHRFAAQYNVLINKSEGTRETLSMVDIYW